MGLFISVIFLLLCIALIIACGLSGSFSMVTPDSHAWSNKWPPISKDEFMRRCRPGTNRERALKARRIIAKHLGIDYEQIYPEQSFVEDLGI